MLVKLFKLVICELNNQLETPETLDESFIEVEAYKCFKQILY